ncbi:MAG: hypothetical protein R3A12_06370 [Ignavibacteria bacterium]
MRILFVSPPPILSFSSNTTGLKRYRKLAMLIAIGKVELATSPFSFTELSLRSGNNGWALKSVSDRMSGNTLR